MAGITMEGDNEDSIRVGEQELKIGSMQSVLIRNSSRSGMRGQPLTVLFV